jgi:hypothetical protein
MAYLAGNIVYAEANNSCFIPSANLWIPSRQLSLIVGLAANVVIALLLFYINKRFIIIRSVSKLFIGMFLIMQVGFPSVMGQFYDGTLLCLMILCAMVPFFSTFQRPDRTRRLFLTFCIISFGSAIDYSFALYLLVFLLGCFQMQCLSLRGLLAVGLGILVPYWIMWGFGLISIDTFAVPSFVSIFNVVQGITLVHIFVYTGITLLLGAGLGILNMMHIYSYNGRSRAYNGFWMLLSVVTVVLCFVDYSRLIIYLPILNCCTAVQIGHFFTINNVRRSFIPILCIVGIYVALFVWSLSA